jgi:flagellar hook-associated protein FlgK
VSFLISIQTLMATPQQPFVLKQTFGSNASEVIEEIKERLAKLEKQLFQTE